ncbi:MAG: diphosphomevalonate/mevalonate 3,5-bisphosphate decarboxylase family protein [Bacteroidia bacterium]
MTHLISPLTQWEAHSGRVRWTSPSNIALVKYWGKTGLQQPANASLSFTLDHCKTDTAISFAPKSGGGMTLYLDGQRSEAFEQKVLGFLGKIEIYFPWIKHFELRIDTSNSFPHSSGIASSASGMSALALGLLSIDQLLANGSRVQADEDFYRAASYLARIGSGSACRSVYGGLVMWGAHDQISQGAQEWGVSWPDETHAVFADYQDTILLVHAGQKSVSSTVGHGLMHGHPFASQRFEVAQERMMRLKFILKSGDLEAFGALVEAEALMLHALMMASEPYFLLMKPGTVAIIEKIWDFRKQNAVPVHFTLDAGANVHLLYPKNHAAQVKAFIDNELAVHCEQKAYICDAVGKGPVLLEADL